MISKEEVKHIAGLARLELSETEIEKMQKDLSAILDYFDLLKKAPRLEKSIVAVGDLSATRKDEVDEKVVGLSEKLVENAPNKKDDYIKVKTIL